jgi:micrococcal nuclease
MTTIRDLAFGLAAITLMLTWLPAAAQDRIPATVTGVVDGDAIWVRVDGGTAATVRLIGIDTPETKHPTKPVQCFGLEASAKTGELLPPGTRVELEMDVQPTDRYGRTLAYAWREGWMVNQQLVAEGYALTLTIPPNVKYAEQFSAAAQAAREEGLGLWSACAGTPLEPTDDAPSEGGGLEIDEGTRVPLAPSAKPQAGSTACDPSYPDFCIPPSPPDLNCNSPVLAGRQNFTVLPPDPHRFDADHDGVGCERR